MFVELPLYSGYLATLIGIGLFFDKIFIDDETKVKIQKFIKTQNSDYPKPIFKNYLNLTIDAVFKKYLNHKLISSEYFIKCCIISLISLMIILVLQIEIFGLTLPENFNLNSHQLIILIVFLLVNVFIDYISIAQTHAFFMIANQQKTIGRMILLVVSDLILTINLFILLYSLFISFLLMYENSYSFNITAKYTVQTDGFRGRSKSEWPVETIKEKSLTNLFDLKTPKVTTGTGWVPIIAHSNTDEISIVDVYDLYSNIIKMKISPGEHFLTYETFTNAYGTTKNNIKKYKIGQRSETIKSITKEMRDNHEKFFKESLDNEYVESYKDHQEVHIGLQEYSINNNFNLAHGVSFLEVDVLEDAFPVSLLRGIDFLSIGKINQSYVTGLSRGNIIYGCFLANKNYQLVWETAYSPNIFNKECRKKVSLVTANFHHEIGKLLNEKFKLHELYVPLTTFFLTSLVITFSIYIFLIFLIASKIFQSVILTKLKHYEKIFLKSPFAIIGFIIGAIYMLIGFISSMLF